MRSAIRLTFAALAAAIMLAAVGGTASANTFSISDTEIEVVFDDLTFEGSLGNIICDVTLLGNFHRSTITKSVPQLLGFIDHAVAEDATCTDTVFLFAPDGEVTQESLPWHISFDGWEGTLPRIDAILLLLRDAGFRITGLPISGGTCPFVANVQGIATPEAGGTTLESDPSISYPSTEPEDCPEGAFVSGARRVTDLSGTEDVHITLV